MGWGPTSAQVKAFGSQAFIARAINNPFQVASVLSFFFNVDYRDPNHGAILKSGTPMVDMEPYWYAGGKDYDDLFHNFRDAIRTVGRRQTLPQDEWQSTVDGKMAQLLLCDRFSRNAFRGQEEAFAYDEVARDIAREISQGLVDCQVDHGDITVPNLVGQVYVPYLQFVISPMMHSEHLDDHRVALQLTEFTLQVAPDNLQNSFQRVHLIELEHKAVLDRFGRYPHRNQKLGRESTAEELEWLAKEDELPGWAKSQV